ncbi:MAG: tyrosine-type recombinase/integrase [Pirellulales bacterium]|nr:tyrosine-type recombinase/integrase [Pirellulales bacterium]
MASIYKKPVILRDPKTGEKVKKKSKKWWGRYTDSLGCEKRVPLATDKAVAQTMLKELVQKVERQKAGLEDPIDEEMLKPIDVHLDDFEKSQKSKNNSPRYVMEIKGKIRRFVDTCGWKRASQIKATDVQSFLADLREDGLSIQTSNHYLRAIKNFTRWLVNNKRLKSNPLDGLAMLNTCVDRRHDRRPLSQDEFSRLVKVAEKGPPAVGLCGRDRAMLYILAAWTGLRRGELGSLTRQNFKLNAKPPIVTVEAAYSKHRREDIQILHPDIVERFQKWLVYRKPAPGEILFPIDERTCGVDRRTSEMMMQDLKAARAIWIDKAKDEEEHKRREASDFLKYQDSQGRFADFHSLRHTFVTNLCKADISPKTAQTLARHSDIRLTMNIYSHVDLEDQSAAIAKLPGIDGENDGRAAG